ncbi:tRNA (adenosine(37)-N6)-dimethylallyltransferase MiaA [Rothia kristinae]|uniref:tRNA (adenosine(37)-N6)-dimethylallyltransferase MiaA n=1 Tax=Rothia kristinae TaxID=37923 RepID=UPI0011AA3C9E|nr:tRNA (adenosine(37)-N6)-dimethylallyltransferase MiaA [Rothia kristinae]
MTLPIIAVLGPTGTGKSDLGVALARAVDGEVVNADSMQLYRGMDIGTAKLTPAERYGVPHHLLDVLDVREEASVARYQREARERFAEIRGRGRTPILVGGSGLYARAALDVLEFPPTDAEVRQRWQELLETEGRGVLAARLEAVDPVSAGRGLDDRRLVRALEVHELTGRPFSSYMPRREHREPALQIGLNGPRDLLHERLGARVHRMVRAGLVEEVRGLAERGLREGRTASRALGYAQFLRVVDGEASEEEAAQETIIATRRFARRQVTWFRADPRTSWIGFTLAPRQQLDRALALIEEGRTPRTAPDGESEG